MSPETRKQAGILIIIIPTVIYGGVSLLNFLINDPAYMQNPLRQNLFRAGHAHAGVMLILSLVALLYIDEANLSKRWKWVVRTFIPSAAIFLPAAFFFSVLKPHATEPNALINLAYVGVALLVTGLVTLGVGLIRKKPMVSV
jgi:hypothetical protein